MMGANMTFMIEYQKSMMKGLETECNSGRASWSQIGNATYARDQVMSMYEGADAAALISVEMCCNVIDKCKNATERKMGVEDIGKMLNLTESDLCGWADKNKKDAPDRVDCTGVYFQYLDDEYVKGKPHLNWNETKEYYKAQADASLEM